MTFPKEFINTILDRISVSDEISKYVKLQKRGRNFTGLCPFHHEKTPSFTVNDDKGFYHCFGCGAHGNAINFEMHINNYSFFEVVKNFANQLGLNLPSISDEEKEREKQQAEYYKILEKTSDLFQQNLYSKPGTYALNYLKNKRKLSDDIIKRFKLGYAPKNNLLLKYFKQNNVDINKLLDLGLVLKSEKYGLHDAFFDRVMFPIQDPRGRVIAFGGRVLNDGLPKYINSPETPLFKKNKILYGLAQARETVYTDKRIIAVEGYVDVISMVSAGITSVVAPLGTAIGENHFNLLWKLNNKPILCFDGDEAGRKAAIRASFLALPFLKAGKSLQIAILPEGDDPDDLIKKSGTNALNTVLNSASPLIDIIWKSLLNDNTIDTPEDKAKFENEIKRCCNTIKDTDIKKFYLQELNNRMWKIFNKGKQQKSIKKNNIKYTPADHQSVRIIKNNTPDLIFNLLAYIICFPNLALQYIESKHLFLQHNNQIDEFIHNLFSIISEYQDMITPKILLDRLLQSGHNNLLNKLITKIELYKTMNPEIIKQEIAIFLKKKEKEVLEDEIKNEVDETRLNFLQEDKNRIDKEILNMQKIISEV